ncbi:MAG: leishmanolysin-related zinc metalloendopeptidase [Anaeromyxobacter sp.]
MDKALGSFGATRTVSRRGGSHRTRLALLAALVAGSGACGGGGGSSNSAPTAAVAAPANASTSISAGQALSYAATCTDPDGDPTYKEWVFPSGTPSSSTTLTGSVAWSAAGSYVVTFRCRDSGNRYSSLLTRTVVVGDALPPASVVAYSVTSQTGHPSEGISDRPAVKVEDQNGTGVGGVQVTFAVTQGGGAISSTTATSDINGIARLASWTLGTSGAQTVTATASGFDPVTFQATLDGTSSHFHIQLLFLAEPSAEVRSAFTSAAERIGRVVTLEETNYHVTATAAEMAGCGDTAVDVQADDLVILADVTAIDGGGGILGQAGPCLYRTGGTQLPILGLMQFDEVDLANMDVHDLDSVILHEMLHVVGFGTYWQFGNNLLGSTGSTTNPQFNGSFAVSAYTAYNGGSGTTVPVEGTGGAGTKNAHWRETTFKNELMTGWLNGYPTAAPMSRTTIASLQDIGYTVDVTQADAFDITTAVSNLLAPGVEARVYDVSEDHLPFTPRPVPAQ